MLRVLDDWLLTPQRAAVYLPTATAVVADLHLGYAQARQRSGEAVPAPSLAQSLAGLATLFRTQEVRRLVIAGDLVEAGPCAPVLAELLVWLRGFNVELVGIVPGNHDRDLSADTCPVVVAAEGISLGNWRVIHGDGPCPAGRVVQGHEHPCVRWNRHAAPCYLVSEDHLVLPAFSADAAGGNVTGDRRWRSYRCCGIAAGKVLDLGTVNGLTRWRSQART